MPYFVYRVLASAQLRKLAEFDAFRDASSFAKTLRSADDAARAGKVKVMFADNERLAEDLLCAVRDPGPIGDD